MCRHTPRIWGLFLVLVLVVMLAGATPPVQVAAQDVPTCVPEPVGNRPDAPYWAQHGPHWVGFTEFTVENGDRPIPIAMWYPALNPDCVEERITYEYDAATMKGITVLSSMFPREGKAIRDAAPDRAKGPYPLVIYLGSMFGHKMAGLVLGEHLASQGYVVMSGTYEDNPNNTSVTGFGRALLTRALDISRLIDHAEVMNTEERFTSLINTELVAPIGFFTGDVAAAEAGGARLNLASARAWADENDPHNGYVWGLENASSDIAEILGVDIPADGLWPSIADRRVKAVVLLGAMTIFTGEAGYRSLRVPTLIVDNDLDASSPDAFDDYDWIAAEDKAMAVFDGADVWIFNPECVAARGDYQYCSDRTWDMDRVHDLLNHFVTAFLNYELLGNTRLCGALQPASVNVPNIRFESTIRCRR